MSGFSVRDAVRRGPARSRQGPDARKGVRGAEHVRQTGTARPCYWKAQDLGAADHVQADEAARQRQDLLGQSKGGKWEKLTDWLRRRRSRSDGRAPERTPSRPSAAARAASASPSAACGAARGLARDPARRDRRRDRAERRRQNHALQLRHRRLSARRGRVCASRGKRSSASSRTQVAELGLARTFQNIELFSRMSVLDNVLLGRHRHMTTGAARGYAGSHAVRDEEVAQRRQSKRSWIFWIFNSRASASSASCLTASGRRSSSRAHLRSSRGCSCSTSRARA